MNIETFIIIFGWLTFITILTMLKFEELENRIKELENKNQ